MAESSQDLPTTRDRILEAGIEAASIHGITRLTVGDVAKRAGVSRPTLYKHFRSKEDLVAAAVAREADVMVLAVVDAVAPIDDPRLALEAAIAAVLRITRDHPLLDRVIRTEPEALLPLLVADDGPVITRVRAAIDVVLAQRFEEVDDLHRRRFADLVGRLLVSFAVNAPDDPPEVVAAAVASILVDGIWSFVDASSPKEIR